MALAVPVYVQAVRELLNLAVWDPVIVLSGDTVDCKVDIYNHRLATIAVAVVDVDVQLLDGLWSGLVRALVRAPARVLALAQAPA